MYIPKHFHWVFPNLSLMAGFYLVHHWPGVDTYFLLLCFGFVASCHAVYLWKAGELYQGYMTHPTTDPDLHPLPSLSVRPLPPIRTNDMILYQAVDRVQFDKERNFAIALIRMNEFDPGQVNLTETRWVRSGKFSRAEYVTMLKRWSHYGVITRKAERKNSPYVVGEWQKVRLIANGSPLPPLPR